MLSSVSKNVIHNLRILGKFVDTRISVFGAFYGYEKYKCNLSILILNLLNVPCLILIRFCIFNFLMEDFEQIYRVNIYC